MGWLGAVSRLESWSRLAGVVGASRCFHASIASALSLCLGVGCATPSYALFYERYAGTCQVAVPPAAAADAAAPGPKLEAAKDAFIAALNDHDGELRQCYSDSLRYGETHGKIRLQVGLRPDGRVEPVTLLSDTTTFAPMACCVVAVVRALRLEPLSGAAAVSFEYPFSFRTIRTTSALGNGIPLSHSNADRRGYLAELDESTVAIGGIIMYPVAPDGVHYHSDVE